MGYGGLINTIVDPFNIGGTSGPKTPNPNRVGSDYLNLISAFSRGAPTVFNTEQQFKPQYAGLDLQNLLGIAPGYAGAFSALSPNASGVVRGANPGQTNLLDTLTNSASQQLAAGASLDPALARVTQQSIRGGQAARGMGFGPADTLQESSAITSLGDQLRQERQGFAGNVAGMNNQFETQPTLQLLTSMLSGAGAISQGAGPTIIPSNQSYDAFNTAYNARAAANIAGANNAAAANNSY